MEARKHFRNAIIYIIISIAIMGIIFYFSAENSQMSNTSSGNFKKIILNIISPVLPDKAVSFIMEYIRKIAHFTLYFSLGLSTALTAKEIHQFKYADRRVSVKAYIYAFAFCIIYSVSDELHQYFVPGRSCKLTDVLLDSCGALTSILLVCIISTIIHLRCKNGAAAK